MQQTRTPFADLPHATQAGILCNDPAFQKFAAIRSGLPNHTFTTTAAAEYLRTCCKITSRRDIDTNAAAAARFLTLRTEFDAWAGRIASQR